MRIAYLFAETTINYDIDFQVLSALSPDELKSLDTLVRTGVWGLFVGQGGKTLDKIVQERLAPLLHSGEGHITTTNDRLIESIASDKPIYTVQFVSLGRLLALALHKRLSKHDNYLGYVQVLADLPLHHQVFGICGPRYQIENGKVWVLYSSKEDDDDEDDDDDEFFADEIVNHWRQNHNDIKYFGLISALEKRNMSFRYTALDVNDGSSSDVSVQKALRQLGDMWDEHAEKTLWRFQDVAPKAQGALFTALNTLNGVGLSHESAAQVAVSLRRTLEEITRKIVEDERDDESPGWVVRRWKKFKDQNPKRENPQKHLFATEALDLDGVINRLEAQLNVENRSIHKNLLPNVFRSVVLRLVLLLNDLTEMRFGDEGVQLEPDLFLKRRPSGGK